MLSISKQRKELKQSYKNITPVKTMTISMYLRFESPVTGTPHMFTYSHPRCHACIKVKTNTQTNNGKKKSKNTKKNKKKNKKHNKFVYVSFSRIRRELRVMLLLAGCLMSQQHVIVSQGWICSGCHIETEVADQLAISSSHSILTTDQPVVALTL